VSLILLINLGLDLSSLMDDMGPILM